MESRTELGGGIRRHHPPETPFDAQGPSLTQEELTTRCLALAKQLGFVRAGVSALDDFECETVGLQEFLDKGYAGSMAYLAQRDANGRLQRLSPRSLMPGACCAISVALAYPAPEKYSKVLRRRESGDNMVGDIASYARGTDYHLVLKELLLLLADRIAGLTKKSITARACVDSAPLFERDLAIRAGYAFVGKNTLAIAPGAGSHFLLGELLLDIDLLSEQKKISEGCGACTLCLDKCPTQAFEGPYVLDARSCISYLTIESKEDIPKEKRARLSDKIFGCDICQSVCPYNQSGERRPSADQLKPHEHLTLPELIEVLTLTSSKYRRFVAKTALRRVSRNQLARNAAVALGNSGSPRAVEALYAAALDHKSLQVRAHCTWALGELSSTHKISAARTALHSLRTNSCEEVAREARSWSEFDDKSEI